MIQLADSPRLAQLKSEDPASTLSAGKLTIRLPQGCVRLKCCVPLTFGHVEGGLEEHSASLGQTCTSSPS
jgi:hypothetical protein